MDTLVNELVREAISLGRARAQLAAAESSWETPMDNLLVARLRMDVEAHETTVDIVRHELEHMHDRLSIHGGDF